MTRLKPATKKAVANHDPRVTVLKTIANVIADLDAVHAAEDPRSATGAMPSADLPNATPNANAKNSATAAIPSKAGRTPTAE